MATLYKLNVGVVTTFEIENYASVALKNARNRLYSHIYVFADKSVGTIFLINHLS